MRIVSKYKDFYDSFGYVLGEPDNSITYVRNTQYISMDNKDYKDIIKKLDFYNIQETGGYCKDNRYVAHLDTVVVGFYPYIYICPFYVIQERTNRLPGVSFETVFDIKPISISEDYALNKSLHEHIYNKVQTKFNEYKKSHNINGKLYISELTDYSSRTWWNSREFPYLSKSWKIENQDIFKELNIPVFVYCGFRTRHELPAFLGFEGLCLNPIIVNMSFDILGANRERIINEQNVYIDIENFLWETKKEPDYIPDNKTKILNAGFDLKTSFRKM